MKTYPISKPYHFLSYHTLTYFKKNRSSHILSPPIIEIIFGLINMSTTGTFYRHTIGCTSDVLSISTSSQQTLGVSHPISPIINVLLPYPTHRPSPSIPTALTCESSAGMIYMYSLYKFVKKTCMTTSLTRQVLTGIYISKEGQIR